MSLAELLTATFNNPHRPLASIAAASFRGDQIVDEAYVGHRTIAPTELAANQPVTPETKFRVASISKLVATMGVMQLVEQNKLALDADVSDYLGFRLRHPNHPDSKITLAMLLSHTSSIRDGGEQYSLPIPYTIREFFFPDGAFYADGAHWAPIDETPGAYFHYCNLNFGLIGTLIEIASGWRFDQYMQQHVFVPLGLDASYNVRDFSDDSLANLAVLYRKQDGSGRWQPTGPWFPQVDNYEGGWPDEVVRIENPASIATDTGARDIVTNQLTLADYVVGTNGTLFSPQGGLRISARGLAIIGQLLCNGGTYNGACILRPESVQKMVTPIWTYNRAQPNGDPYGGLMRSWGLSTHLITNYSTPANGDRLVQEVHLAYAGHSGDAYGLHSGLWFDPNGDTGFAYVVGGVGAEPEEWLGEYSSFYRWEEEIMTALYQTL